MNPRHRPFDRCLEGRVCLVGLGNTERGDDGVGVRLAERLDTSEFRRASAGEGGRGREVVVAGTEPERQVWRVSAGGFDQVIFLDAVDFGGAPGSVVLLEADQMAARFPQVSTHKLSLGLLASVVEAHGKTKAWLVGVQPETLAAGCGLSGPVRATLEVLVEIFEAIGQRSTLNPQLSTSP